MLKDTLLKQLSGAVVMGSMILGSTAQASDNPFALQSIKTGTLVASAAGEAKCGAKMMKHELVDKNGDGQVTTKELEGHVVKILKNLDRDHSGALNEVEFLAFEFPADIVPQD